MGAGDDSGTKEFDPTPSKLRQLRQQGNVPKSQELNQLFSFIVAVTFILVGGGFIWGKLQLMFIALYGSIKLGSLSAIGAGFLLKHTAEIFAIIIIPLLFAVSFSSAMGDFLQVGIMLTPMSLKMDKLNPQSYFKQTFSLKKVIEFLKQLAKVLILTFVAYKMVKKHLLELITLVDSTSIIVVGSVLKEVVKDFTINATIALLIVTIIDFAFQRINFVRENRMTRKQMMDEFKQNEGDPHMKQKRKMMAREMTQGQQLQLVREADFVTTNPTKIAIAVKYSQGDMEAPKVLAKGSDSFAYLIVQKAKEHNVPVIENIPLARALFKLVKAGKDVPPELYKAVAEVLLFAYKVTGKAKEFVKK